MKELILVRKYRKLLPYTMAIIISALIIVLLLSSIQVTAAPIAQGRFSPPDLWITPSCGPPNTLVQFTIPGNKYSSVFGYTYIVEEPHGYSGKFELWWSDSPTMLQEKTAIKIGEGEKEREKSCTVFFRAPNMASGTYYIHLISPGKDMLNFSFYLSPQESHIKIQPIQNIRGVYEPTTGCVRPYSRANSIYGIERGF